MSSDQPMVAAARSPAARALSASWQPRMQAAFAAVPHAQTPRLWLDIGTSFRTLAKWDIEHNSSLVVVGVDPLKANIEHSYQPTSARFVRIQGACAESAGTATFYAHKSPTCGTLNPTRRDAPTVGSGKDACTGDVPVPTQVPTFPLRLLMRSLPARRRVELLKIDVQGSELMCLRSAGLELRRVDNVLLEVQDAEEGSRLLMYENAPSIPELDALMASHGLVRQYCERNFYGKELREINCLYTNVDPVARRLWATGNFQRLGSMVSYADLPSFRNFALAHPLKTVTGSWPGERVTLLGERKRRGRTRVATNGNPSPVQLKPLSAYNASAATAHLVGAERFDWYQTAANLNSAFKAVAGGKTEEPMGYARHARSADRSWALPVE